MSLIELMVVLLLSSILLIAVVSFFVAQKTTYQSTSSVAQIQENGRIAAEIIAQDIRMAGFHGCSGSSGLDKYPAVVSGQQPDSLQQAAISGYETGTAGWSNGLHDALIDVEAEVRPGSDVLMLQYMDSASVAVEAHGVVSESLTVGLANELGLVADDLIVVSNCRESDVLQVTAMNASSSLELSYTGSENEAISGHYSADSVIAKLVARIYYIKDTDREHSDGSPVYGLFVKDISNAAVATSELLADIEYLQLLYGVPKAAGLEFIKASDVTDFSDVRSINISLLASSNKPVRDDNDTQDYVLLDETITDDGAGSTLSYDSNRLLRRVFTDSVVIRNRVEDL